MSRPPSGRRSGGRATPGLQARRLALLALFEGEFGVASAGRALERLGTDRASDPEIVAHARRIVEGVHANLGAIDRRIAHEAPEIPVHELGRIERTIMRSVLFEVLYSAATPSGEAIRDAVALARIYAGDAGRRLINGVLGSVSRSSGGAGWRRPTTG
ncbi:MAG: transcription antitermination protein NusB [Candidatus Limnocylindria bacterium]